MPGRRPAPEAAAFEKPGGEDEGSGGLDSDCDCPPREISASSLHVGGGGNSNGNDSNYGREWERIPNGKTENIIDGGPVLPVAVVPADAGRTRTTGTHSPPAADAVTVTPEGTKKLAVLVDDLDRLVKSLIGHSESTNTSTGGGGGSLDVSAEEQPQPGDGADLEAMATSQALLASGEPSRRRRDSECSNRTDGTGHSSVWDGIDEEEDDDVGDGVSSDIHSGTATSGTGRSRSKKSVDLCRELQLDLGGDAMMDAVEDLLSSTPPQPAPETPSSPPPPPTPDSGSLLLSPTRTLSGKKISSLTLLECHTEKKRLKRRLQRYDADFYQRFGRRAEKDDKEPIRALYEIYSVLKERISDVEAQELLGCGTSTVWGEVAAGNTDDRRKEMQLSELVRIVEEDEDEFSSSSSASDSSDAPLKDESTSDNDNGIDDYAEVHNDSDDIGDLLVKELVEEYESKNTSDDHKSILNVTPPPDGTAASPCRSLHSPQSVSEVKSPGQARIEGEINAQPPLLRKGFVKNQVQKLSLSYRSREDNSPVLVDQVDAADTETSKMDLFPDFGDGNGGAEPSNFEFFSSDFFPVQRNFASPSPTKATSSKHSSSVNPDSPIKPKTLFDTALCPSPVFTVDTADTAEVTAASPCSNVSSGFDLSSPAKQNDKPVPIVVLLMDVTQDKFDLLGIIAKREKRHVKHLLDAITGAINTHNRTSDDKEESSSSIVETVASAGTPKAPLSSCSASEGTDRRRHDACSSSSSLCDPPTTINVKDTDASVGSSINLSTCASSSVRSPFHAAAFGPGTRPSLGTGSKCSVQYDGLIQVKLTDENAFEGMLLINCFGLKRYDVTPHELFVAKPVGMSVKEASEHAGRLTKHLLGSGMLCSADGALTLSLSALTRAAGPSAPIEDNTTEPVEAKFLSFSPPFDIGTDVADKSGTALQTAFEDISMDEGANKDNIKAVSDLLDLYPNCEEGDGVAEACPPDPLLKKVWKPSQESLHLGSFFAAVSPFHDEGEEVLMVEQYVKPRTSASPRKRSIKKSLSTITNKAQIVGKAKQIYGASFMNRYAKVDEPNPPGICRLDLNVSEDEKISTTSNEEVIVFSQMK